MGRVLERFLSLHPNQSSSGPRPVWSWRQRDKMSSSWLLCLPGAEGLSSSQFSEGLANLLCMPSPCCLDRVGEKIGKTRSMVDVFGDRLCSETGLPGDDQRRRHDEIKVELNAVCGWAGLQTECEPYGLFSQHVPQQPLNRLEGRQARQVLRPDFLFNLPSTSGVRESRVADIKTVSCGAPSWYKAGQRGVDRRAARVPAEYDSKAKAMDRELGVQEGLLGPVGRRLQELGPVIPLVFGGFGEVSEGV